MRQSLATTAIWKKASDNEEAHTAKLYYIAHLYIEKNKRSILKIMLVTRVSSVHVIKEVTRFNWIALDRCYIVVFSLTLVLLR